MAKNSRIEHDFLGDREISNDCYYGVQTLRAKENFFITGVPISEAPFFINGLAYVKKAAAMANRDLGVLNQEVANAIIKACDEIIVGNLHDQFIVDMIQGGAGTSTNMNANEVIANRASEILGYEKGRYDIVHPNNHVNCSQSTNDAYPTAFRVALYNKVGEYMNALDYLQKAFAEKGNEFEDVLKMGRTQLQDAVPMTLGQEFTAFAVTIREDIKRLQEARMLVTEVNLGATAIGTRLNAPPGYPELATSYLGQITGIPITLAEDLIEATSDTGAYVQVSGVLKRTAVKISKICNDLRLLSSGPRAGFHEINLPKLQPGSSIMPGKVNPVIPEVVNQVAFQVIGADVAISMAAEAGQLQLNVMEPVIAYNLFLSFNMMIRATHTLVDKCIKGITANKEVCRNYVIHSIGIVTALNPILGYEICASIAKEALESGGSVYDIVLSKGLLSKDKLDQILSPENLKKPTYISK
jgi:aspartate ammonia-lyase